MAWPPEMTAPLALAAAGAVLVVGGLVLGRSSGARMGLGRRFAGAAELRVGDVSASAAAAGRPIRVTGRVRCSDPILADGGERLVALHRTIEVRLARTGWRPVERIRESRGFQLWDHSGQLSVDPSSAAEPLLVIPAVWHGTPDELPESYRPALGALERRHDDRATAARAETRTVSVVDQLLVLAQPVVRADGRVALEPPPGGFVISAVPLDSAMRLLGGEHRGRLFGGVVIVALGSIAIAAGLIWLLVALAT